MKNNKLRKALAGLVGLGMAASMVFGTAGAVLADDPEPAATSYSFNKVYEEESAHTGTGTSPAETFTFGTVTGDTASGNASLTAVSDSTYAAITDVPDGAKSITIGSAAYREGEAGGANKTKPVTITVPEASVYAAPGHYTYEFKENAGSTAGVVYDSDTYRVVVAVVYGDDNNLKIESVKLHKTVNNTDVKGENISNRYHSGQVTITKKVTGSMGDRAKAFSVKVTLTKPQNKTVGAAVKVSATNGVTSAAYNDIPANAWSSSDTVERTYQVKDGTSIVLTNIPEGMSYAVQEDASTASGYTITYTKNTDNYTSNTNVNVSKDTDDTVTITNDKNGTGDTGISASNRPYVIVLLALGCAVAVYAVAKSRRKDA